MERMWRKGKPCTLLVGVKIGAATVHGSTQKLKIELSDDPAIPFPGIYLEKMKTLIQKKATWTLMLIATQFTKSWKISKQPKCPPIDNWIKKM